MGFRSDEQIVYGEHGLAIVKSCFRHGDGASRAAPCENFGHNFRQIAGLEWQEPPFPTGRIGIHAHDRLAVEILECVSNQAVLAESNYNVIWRENEVWKEASVHHLHAA